jgi:hypothetical protein
VRCRMLDQSGERLGATFNPAFQLRFIAAALCISCGIAEAQDNPRLYVSAAVSSERQDPGTDQYARLAGEGAGENVAFVPGVTLSAGVSLKPWLGIEGSVDLAPSLTFPWTYNYIPDVTLNQASHRDVSILGYVRIRPRCHQRVCIEPLVGAGVSLDHAESVAIADCGPVASPRPCTPIKGPAQSDVADSWFLTVSSRVDLLIRVTSHVALGPTARLSYIFRDSWLLPYPGVDFRGPVAGSNWVPTIGFGAMWK